MKQLSTLLMIVAVLGIIGLQASPSVAVTTEIVLCLDVSGSISSSELVIEIDGLKACLTNVVPQDASVGVAIVVYGVTAANALGALTPVTPASLTNTIFPALDGLTSNRLVGTGATNTGQGLIDSRAILAGGTTSNQFILLVGDGASNTGPPVAAECVNTANAGIVICAIAVGATAGGITELQDCANATGGSFGNAVTFNDFEVVCEDCLKFIIFGGYFLDIKPTSCPNAFNLKLFEFAQGAKQNKGGVLPVAILGGETVDVADIDVSTVRLEGVAPLRSNFEDVSSPVDNGNSNDDCVCTTAGPDGFTDLTLKFQAQSIAAAIVEGLPGDELALTLTFETFDGTSFEVQDCIRFVGNGTVVVNNQPPPPPPPLTVNQAYPNPFNPVTMISYVLGSDMNVKVSVYDVTGRLIERLVDGFQPAGDHSVQWEAKGVPSGVYFYRVEAAEFVQTSRMILLK